MPAPPEWLAPDATTPIAAPDGRAGNWLPLDDGRLWVADSFLPLLRNHTRCEAGSLTFDSVFELPAGTDVRQIGPRRTTRFEFSGDGESPTTFEVYLKRYGQLGWSERLKNWVKFRQPDHGAEPEFRALCELTRLGIATLQPLAFGQSGGRSLLFTAGLTGYRDLKALLQANDPLVTNVSRRRKMIEWLADLARTMHGAGFHHQDFYLNHVLVSAPTSVPARPNATGLDVDLRLIDLGRVRQRRPLARRWILKDLAQLHYSSQGAADIERMRFFRRYLGRKITAADRRFLRALLRKSIAIDRHTRRHGL